MLVWTYTPRLALPVWPTRPGPKSTCLCGPYGHTQATTQPCATHDHAFVDHTVVSCTWPTTWATTRSCGVDSPVFQILPKFDFLHFGYTP
ncbi:hypothetical protein J1N35_010929, partial [Gossypium stocksii]